MIATGGSVYNIATTSAADGVYRFIGVPVGAYTLVQEAPQAYTTTTASSVDIVVTAANETVDFGDTLILYVTGAEFVDTNHDGVRAPVSRASKAPWSGFSMTPTPMAGWIPGEALLGAATTDHHGFYVIGGITPATV